MCREISLCARPESLKLTEPAVDDFHMNYGIRFSESEATDRAFVVKGKYDVAPNTPPWGWKTVLEVIDENQSSRSWEGCIVVRAQCNLADVF